MPPTFTPIKSTWRGNTSSADMNTNFEQILYDLNTAFADISSLVVDLNNIESRIRHDTGAISSRLYAVSGLVSAYDRAASGYKMFHEDFYLTKDTTYPEDLPDGEKCVVDTQFGIVTLPVSNSFSKVYTIGISDGKIYRMPDLSVDVTPSDEDGNVKVEELSVLNAFDGTDESVWERKVRFNRDHVKDSISCELELTLPSMSNPYVNKVFFKPYPDGTIDVTDVEYDTLTSQDNILPTFPVDGENNIRSKMYSFNNIQPTKMRFYLRQRNNELEEDYKTFVYGAQEIGIEKVEYKPSGKIGVKFTLPSYETGLLSKITSLRTDPGYDNIKYKAYLYISQDDFDSDTPVWTSSNSPITVDSQLEITTYATDSIWVMIEIAQETGDSSSPLFDSITLTYTTTT